MAIILVRSIAQASAEGARRPVSYALTPRPLTLLRMHLTGTAVPSLGMAQLAVPRKCRRQEMGSRAWSAESRSASPPWLTPPFFNTSTRVRDALTVCRQPTAKRTKGTTPSRARVYSLTLQCMKIRRTPIRPETWAGLVLGILRDVQDEIALPALYKLVEQKAKDRLATIPTWQATVRRTVQDLRDWGLAVQVRKGVWQFRTEADTPPVTEPEANQLAA